MGAQKKSLSRAIARTPTLTPPTLRYRFAEEGMTAQTQSETALIKQGFESHPRGLSLPSWTIKELNHC